MEYWAAREQELIYNKQLKLAEKKLLRLYKDCFKRTQADLLLLTEEIGTGDFTVSDLYRYNRYYKTMNNLHTNLKALGAEEQIIYKDVLNQMYSLNEQLIGKAIGFDPKIPEQLVKDAINAVWCRDGKAWSDRVWDNKALLQETIQRGVIDSVVRGDSKAKLNKMLQERFEVGFSQADRIARTELAYVQNKSSIDKYAAAGVEYFEVLNTEDDRNCDECVGGRFRIEEAEVGVNMPPFHPNCRCTVIPVI